MLGQIAANPDWWSALGTIAATVVAVVLGLRSVRLSRQDLRNGTKEKAATREAQKRSQASKVSCWMQQENNSPHHQIHVHNASDQPIWSVEVDHEYPDTGPRLFPVIGAGATRSFAVDTSGKLVADHAVTVRFRDNAGFVWERPRDLPGSLKEVQPRLGKPNVNQSESRES